ncbi:MAG: ribbon-helix-helix protein, CopG family [Candidatus Electrothrix sp. LOE2]|nr:ribbon-helix-helix protein, CopG family [Candidatus Electrothrix sp. LOE2]
MSKTVTLRLNEQIYDKFRGLARKDNRSLSNFIETAVLRYIEQVEYADEFEMAEINGNEELNRSLKNGISDAQAKQGRFV